MTEAEFIAALRPLAGEGSRGLLDDTAVLALGPANLVLTHDMIVEGVHYLPDDPPGDVAWKLVAVNLSDLAAKGAKPVGVLLGYALGPDEWDRAFLAGLAQALTAFATPLLGGDTVAMPAGATRALGLTALGTAATAPSRSEAKPGDFLWVSGSIGDAGAGLRIAKGEQGPPSLLERYRQPRPRLELGQALAPLVHAMMDVSDGLLIDASRMAHASALALDVELDAVPLSSDLIAFAGETREARLAAVTAGDDYELLFAAPEARSAELLALSDRLAIPLSRVGRFGEGAGLILTNRGERIPLPAHLGWEHGGEAEHSHRLA